MYVVENWDGLKTFFALATPRTAKDRERALQYKYDKSTIVTPPARQSPAKKIAVLLHVAVFEPLIPTPLQIQNTREQKQIFTQHVDVKVD